MGSGSAESDVYEGVHWDKSAEKNTANYVRLRFDAPLNPGKEPILSRSELDRGVLARVNWSAQASGIRIPRRSCSVTRDQMGQASRCRRKNPRPPQAAAVAERQS